MYVVKTAWWLRKLYSPGLTWTIPTDKKEIFLTFDDGPHPTITPFVLQCLQQYNAKATFFCVGKNVTQYPDIYQQILDQGHTVGNHTHDHINGWKSGDMVYLKNITLAQQTINSTLFRPPYGRITRSQVKELLPRFKVIMWDVLSGDFDLSLSPQKCFDNVVTNTTSGSIIVFHDSEKALPRLAFALPKSLEFFAGRGYVMKAIS
ncbi:polysaccharide deacetylase family protein [Segetibacter sp.]|jgi:peptidoglycan/xylan/chitin deacetylase (PgdA/CDA1 family)|uniref:polysaccharide deacetylase family protein n=1 Tax=Segetibacter sp. TaxID=2231182 RepID=UPI002617FB9E|nr:polysaccharide deacetylase family protein [Segetibacter sp.]MCW3081062.1 polysaccharide deacetylase [Segetibacter sp.]